jgi:6,7-dimethyl-8-ribityllumazine synthase
MKNFAVILGEFHKAESDKMLAEVKSVISAAGHAVTDILWVPGSYEVPLALERALRKQTNHGAVVLGIIERGETAHGLVMAQAVMAKILDIQITHMKPVGIGILGPEIFPSQIPARAVPYARAAAQAALKMLDGE